MELRQLTQRTVKLFTIFFLSLQFIACEAIHEAIHGETNNASLANDTVLTDNFQVVLAEGVVPVELEGEGYQGAFIFAGPDADVRAISDLAEKELAGYIQQVQEINGQEIDSTDTASDILDKVIAAINGGDQSALTISKVAPNDAFASGSFSLNTISETNNISLAQLIAGLITLELPENSTIAQFAAEQAAELLTTEFRLSISVALDLIEVASEETPAEGEEPVVVNEVIAMVIFTIVNDSIFDSYSERTANIIDESNIVDPTDEVQNQEQTFVAETSESLLSDFLFVIDNSGSMAGEQTALSEAADAFITRIQSSGLDYQIGIITTDNTNLIDDQTDRDTNGDFFSDLEILRTEVAAIGTSGSGNERGIYMSELALSPAAESISVRETPGTVTDRGHPRENASLSVIIVSDEESQYPDDAFDVNNNLFVDNNYRVYSIINLGDNENSQYDDLSNVTGGSIADIQNIAGFPAIMEAIATDAGSLTSPYVLDETPIGSTIKVFVDGVEVPQGADGYQFFSSTNAIIFRGTAIPTAGASIRVTYMSAVAAE